MRLPRLAIAVVASTAIVLVGVGCGDSGNADSTTAETTGSGLPDYCEQVTGEALATIVGDARGTVDKNAVYAVKAETAPDFGDFARTGLYFVAVPVTKAKVEEPRPGYVPVLAATGSWVKTGGGMVFPGDNTSKAYFTDLGTDIEPSAVVGYDMGQEAADQARQCVEQATGAA